MDEEQQLQDHEDRLRVVENDLQGIKQTLRIIAGGVMFFSPVLTAIIIKLVT